MKHCNLRRMHIYSYMFLFSLLADVKEMEVPHLVNEKLRIRIGIHTGEQITIFMNSRDTFSLVFPLAAKYREGMYLSIFVYG